MMSSSALHRQEFERTLAPIVRLHRSGAGGVRVCLALTQRLDAALQNVFRSINDANKASVCVVALGGYGRKELCFHSDTDIMVLVRSDEEKQTASGVMHAFLHALLDLGLDVGHSFRTIEECLETVHGDLESWISMLEGRFVCGNRSNLTKLHRDMEGVLAGADRPALVVRLSTNADLRHQKYGNSTKLLEPNIKNSAGGLRDLHTVLWMIRNVGAESLSPRLSGGATAVTHVLQSKAVKALLPRQVLREAAATVDFLLQARNAMHLQAGTLHDTLEFAFQLQVASALRYRRSAQRSSVEQFMQEYYRATRTVFLLSRRVVFWAVDRWVQHPADTALYPLDDLFALKAGKVRLRSARSRLTNEQILTALLHRLECRAELSYALEDVILRSCGTLKPLRTKKESELFRRILNAPDGVADALNTAAALGVLERWIPEWKPMVAFFQHNQYHYYTADEHTLKVIANAERLVTAQGSFGVVFRSLERRDVLYLAAFLHDIAKPNRIGDHEVTGVRIARKVLDRFRYHDLIPDVAFLVRKHLTMEQVAFRRNLNDPQTIVEFAGQVASVHRLNLLYLLTYADLSAVNRNVWSDWKEMLLLELYRKTREALEGNFTTEQMAAHRTEQGWAAAQRVSEVLLRSFPPGEVEAHQSLLGDPSYTATFPPEEIGDHLRAVRKGQPVAVQFHHWSEFTEVTVIAKDAPYALSRFCGVLAANDANIFDAHVFTRDDGVIVDKFRVTDEVSRTSLSTERCEKIRQDLDDVSWGRADISRLLERHRLKWKRRAKISNRNVRVDVEFEDHPTYTIIDVFAADTLGFLYKVTETISRLGLTIAFAKIATRVDGIVDTFYVLNGDGKKIPEERLPGVRHEILRTITELSGSVLVSGAAQPQVH